MRANNREGRARCQDAVELVIVAQWSSAVRKTYPGHDHSYCWVDAHRLDGENHHLGVFDGTGLGLVRFIAVRGHQCQTRHGHFKVRVCLSFAITTVWGLLIVSLVLLR